MQGAHSQHEQHIISEGYPTIRYQHVVYQLTRNISEGPWARGANLEANLSWPLFLSETKGLAPKGMDLHNRGNQTL